MTVRPRHSVRDKLIAAAVDAFHARGFRACTIEHIADRAKVLKGSFYNHFKSNEALAAEVVKLSKSMSALIDGLAPRGRMIVVGIPDGSDPIELTDGCYTTRLASGWCC